MNVCAHANQLGMRSEVVSAVGDDAPGRKLIGRLDELGVGHAGLQVQRDLPTGTVDVALDASGVPCFTIRSPVAWDAIEPTPEAIRMAREADVMVFGSLAQRDPRSRSAIQALVKATRPDCIRILDINLRPPFISGDVIRESLMLADVLKLNETELPVLTDMLSLCEDESSRLRGIRERLNFKWVVYTKGPIWAVLPVQPGWWIPLGRGMPSRPSSPPAWSGGGTVRGSSLWPTVWRRLCVHRRGRRPCCRPIWQGIETKHNRGDVIYEYDKRSI